MGKKAYQEFSSVGEAEVPEGDDIAGGILDVVAYYNTVGVALQLLLALFRPTNLKMSPSRGRF